VVDSQILQKRQLECLRLASELLYLARKTPNRALKAQFFRSAAMWVQRGRPGQPLEPRALRREMWIDPMTAALASRRPVVLIVDDEPILRMLAVEAVEDAGFAALEAANADQAITLLQTSADIALLFTDINMPGSMDGLALAHAVRNRWPGMKILVVSGQMRLRSSDLPPDSCFLEKPYRNDSMIEKLQLLCGAVPA
jgi:CheY-like chemotaxis protein